MDCSTPGFAVHHKLLKLDQTHVHWVSDAIQQSHPLSSLSPPAFNIAQHQGLFQSVLHIRWPSIEASASASVLPMNIQNWLPLGLTGWTSLQFKGLSRVFSNTTVQKHQFFGAQCSFGEGNGTPLQYSCLENLWTEEPGRLQSMGSLRVRHDWVTSLSFSLSCTGEGNGNPLQCSCLENPRDRGAWWAAVSGVAQSRTWLKWLSSSSSLLYSPTLTSIHDHRKNHSLD